MKKYYKLFKDYYKVINQKQCERVHTYKHHYGIDVEFCFLFDFYEMEEITAEQYERARKLILKKLQNV